MGYWKQSSYLLANDPEVLSYLSSDKIVVVDGGSAGKVFEPFDKIKQACYFFRFEPRDGKGETESESHYINGGLWSEPTKKILHLAKEPTTSSIYPPDEEYLKNYDDSKGWMPRKTVKCIEVPLISIDNAVSEKLMPKPDFIKLDIHSAEYEAVLGSRDSMSDCLGFLVETWHSPVHKGQYLHCDIERLLIESGFSVFASTVASAWRHQLRGEVSFSDRPQLIGSEMLFINSSIDTPKPLKLAIILELFGFSILAQKVIEDNKDVFTNEFYTHLISVLSKNRKYRFLMSFFKPGRIISMLKYKW